MMAWLKAQIRDYFGCTKAETNGICILLLLIMLCLALPPALRYYYTITYVPNNNEDVAILNHMLQTLKAKAEKPSSNPSATTQKLAFTQHCKATQPFDINQADTTKLKYLKGIGSVLAARVIRYRNKLGGFIDQKQYKEIYGLEDSVVKNLHKNSYIAKNFKPKQLNVNTCDFKTLVRHPYITYTQVKNIIAYRSQHGPFPTLQALNKLANINAVALKKIVPYLTVK